MTLQRVPSHAIATSIVVASLVLFVAPTAFAVQIYTYTGTPFSTATDPFSTTDFVTVTFATSQPLAAGADVNVLASPDLIAGSFMMSAGPVTIASTDAEPGPSRLFVSTDLQGNIVGGIARLRTPFATSPDASIMTIGCPTACVFEGILGPVDSAGFASTEVTGGGSVNGSPGTWSAVPEPTTLSMALLGLLAIGASRRERREAAQTTLRLLRSN